MSLRFVPRFIPRKQREAAPCCIWEATRTRVSMRAKIKAGSIFRHQKSLWFHVLRAVQDKCTGERSFKTIWYMVIRCIVLSLCQFKIQRDYFFWCISWSKTPRYLTVPPVMGLSWLYHMALQDILNRCSLTVKAVCSLYPSTVSRSQHQITMVMTTVNRNKISFECMHKATARLSNSPYRKF